MQQTGQKDYLGQLDPEQRAELEAVSTTRHFKKGDAVFLQGEDPDSMLILLEGLIKVTRSSGTGRDVILEFLFPGEICGALCALDCNPYPATGQCVLDSTVTRVPRADFIKLAERYPDVLVKATSCCRAKVRQQREMMVGMAVERADQRAARALLLLAEGLGSRERGALWFPMAIDRREFSELIGTTLETAIRTLSRFRKEGLIREEGGRVILADERTLRELAESGL